MIIKHCLLLIVLSLMPCVVWAEQVSRQEARTLFEQQVAIPCMKYVIQEKGLEEHVTPLQLWMMIMKPEGLELGIQAVLEVPEENRSDILRALKNVCMNGLTVPK